jgi:hypothetical protein
VSKRSVRSGEIAAIKVDNSRNLHLSVVHLHITTALTVCYFTFTALQYIVRVKLAYRRNTFILCATKPRIVAIPRVKRRIH